MALTLRLAPLSLRCDESGAPDTIRRRPKGTSWESAEEGHRADVLGASEPTHLLIGAFRLEQQNRALSTETIRVREVVLTAFAEYRNGDLLGATKDDVLDWLESLSLVARSRAKYLSHLHCFYDFAIRQELTERDPTVPIPRPKLPRLLPRPIGDADLITALNAAPPKVAAMLSLACYEGMRCCEITAFEVEWIWGHGDGSAVIIQGKGGNQRSIPLAAETERALDEYGLPRSGHVFLSRYGRPYRPNSVSSVLAVYLRGIGVNATAHQLRHWFGTECYRRTRDPIETKELLGHASLNTTLGYVSLVPEESTARILRGLSVVRSGPVSSQPSLPFDMDGAG